MPVQALVIVDVQNDFLPGGALAVQEGNQIIPRINELVKLPFDVIVATKDWHPANHGSFASNQGKLVGEVIMLNGIQQILWPAHCVQGSYGSELSHDLDTSHFEKIFYKGVDQGIDSYSCFFDNGHRQSTGMEDYMKKKHVNKVYIAGLATDYCVKYSVFDALQLGFDTYVIEDVCRGVDIQANDCRLAIEEMKKGGAHIIKSDELFINKERIFSRKSG